MSVRAALVVVVVGTVFVIGCSQMGRSPSPTAPSSSTLSSVSGPPVPLSSLSVAPVLTRLNIVQNFLVSANQQLERFYNPPTGFTPPDPVAPVSPPWDQNTLDFYLRANGVLDAIPPNPVSPFTDALNAIIGQANITLNLIATHVIPPNPVTPQIVTQATHTISVATDLQSCGADVCGG